MKRSKSFQGGLIDTFCRSQASSLDFVSMFDDIPEVECFVKDVQGRRIKVSEGIWRRLGFASALEMIGKKDHDLFPAYIADQYVRSDQKIVSSRRPLVGELEIWVNEQGVLDWFIVSKYPIFGAHGAVVGIMGTLRSAQASKGPFTPNSALGKVMEYVRENFDRALSLPELAKVARLSERQLRRRFRQELGLGLAEFIIKTRIQIASARLSRGGDPLAKIAMDVGFCDQSAFTRAFRKQLGVAPGQYRRRYRDAV